MTPYSPLVDAYTDLVSKINAIDAMLEPGASGRKVLNALINNNNATVHEVRSFFNSIINNTDREARVVSAAVVLREASAALKTIVDSFVAENTTGGEEVPADERAELDAERERLRSSAVGVKAALEHLAPQDEIALLPVVPRKKSAGGKRGKRIKGTWSYVIDGENVGICTPTEMVKYVGAGVKAAIVSAALEAKQLDPADLPDMWKVTVNGKLIEATRAGDSFDDGDDDDEDY